MNRWAMRVPPSSIGALGLLRLTPRIDAALAADDVWLRGDTLDDETEQRLLQVPGAERFLVNDEAELTPVGARLPTGWLPDLRWSPLREFWQPEMTLVPVVDLTPVQEQLHLVRDNHERPIAALLASLEAFSVYATSAPLVRLMRLKFLANRAGQALIVGSPLPPLAGARYWENDGIFIAAGYGWQPAIDAALVRRVLGLGEDELAVWQADGSWEQAHRGDLVTARRAAVRATMEELSHGHA